LRHTKLIHDLLDRAQLIGHEYVSLRNREV
jgi:hypothetical protein